MLILRTVLLQVIVGVLLSFTPVTVAGVEQVPLPAVWQFQLDPSVFTGSGLTPIYRANRGYRLAHRRASGGAACT